LIRSSGTAAGSGSSRFTEGVFRELHRLAIHLEVGGAFRAGGKVFLEPPLDVIGELSI
jgi:hypothetical protein